jgi:hypothetical protein
MRSLDEDACLRLLGSVPFGRIVYTSAALPAVRPVSHLVLGGQIIVAASLGAAIRPAAGGAGPVVAYEADRIDHDRGLGWSVVVLGRARLVTDGAAAARYRTALSPSWPSGENSEVIAISAELVTGYQIRETPAEVGR